MPDLTRAASTLSVGQRDKYSGVGGILRVEMLAGLALPARVKEQIVKSANQSLAVNSSATYSGGLASFVRSCEKHGFTPSFPPSDEMQLSWQADMSAAGLAAGTMKIYWAALGKVCHMITGTRFERNQIVAMCIRGAGNTVMKRKKLAVTYPLMKELKKKIEADKKMSQATKAMLWATATAAMCGSFRLGELLPTRGKNGSMAGGLERKDLRRMRTRVQGQNASVSFYNCKVRQPKERRTGEEPSVDVELFSSGGLYCPVRALDDWLQARPASGSEGWVFLFEDGRPMTKAQFNKTLKRLLKGIEGYHAVAGHSFRRAVPSLMAKAGYSDEEIRRQGRWRLAAFELYTVTGRGQRLGEQHALHAALAKLAEQEVETTGQLLSFDGEE